MIQKPQKPRGLRPTKTHLLPPDPGPEYQDPQAEGLKGLCGNLAPRKNLLPVKQAGQCPRESMCRICLTRLLKTLKGEAYRPDMRRHWTEAEDERIRSGYRHCQESIAELATQLQRSEAAVRSRVQKLRITKSQGRKRWTPEEDARLAELAETRSMDRIAVQMGRSPNAVTVRANRLGILRSMRNGWYTMREAAAILGIDSHTLRTHINTGRLKAERHRLAAPGQDEKNLTWHIKEKDLKDFIRGNAHRLTGRNVDLVQIVEILAGLKMPEET